MKSKILQLETEDGLLEDFYPITHCKCVMLNEETNLDDYLNEIIKCAPHKHSNKGILDKITKEYTKEKDEQLQSVINKTTKIKTLRESMQQSCSLEDSDIQILKLIEKNLIKT